MNTELLFSINPFSLTNEKADHDENKNAFYYISPGFIIKNLPLNDNKNTIIEIPKELYNILEVENSQLRTSLMIDNGNKLTLDSKSYIIKKTIKGSLL